MTLPEVKEKILEQMLNDAGYKKHSSINPLILQSKVISLVETWIKFHKKNECPNEASLCMRDCAECPYEKLLERLL